MFLTKTAVVFVTNTLLAVFLFLVRTVHSHVFNTCPDQDLPSLQAAASVHDLSLLFYYVSWNNEALQVKSVYEEVVASYYGHHVHFASVDCWHMACNCSSISRWSQPAQQWPKLIAHYAAGRVSMQYSGHDWSALALRQFVDRLMHPLRRVHSKSEVKQMNVYSDGIVLGLFAAVQQREFVSYTHAAVKWLELDPLQAFRLTVAVGDATKEILGMAETLPLPRLLFINPKGIEVFNGTRWDSNQIVLWLQQRMKRMYRDLHTYTAPGLLGMRLQHEATLNIFTVEGSRFYNELRHVFHGVMQRPKYCDLPKMCLRQEPPPAKQEGEPGQCRRIQFLKYADLPLYYQVNDHLRELMVKLLRDEAYPYKNSSNNNNIGDPQHFLEQHLCHRGPEYYALPRKVAVAKFLKRSVDLVREQCCHHHHHNNTTNPLDPPKNRTLAVNILDGHRHVDLLLSLGLAQQQPNASTTTTTVFIADTREESVFLMPAEYSYAALMEFVRLYYDNQLAVLGRHLQNAPPNQAKKARPPSQPQGHERREVRVLELNGAEFREAIDGHPERTYVVMLYTTECTLSNVMAHSLLQVAALMRLNQDLVVARVNVRSNELPWPYQMADTPNLLVVPRGRVRDEAVYPKHIKVNVPNVYGFVVRHLEASDQVRALLHTCQLLENMAERQQRCLNYVKNLTVHHIGRHLKRWQFVETERAALVEQLQELKQLNYVIQRQMLF